MYPRISILMPVYNDQDFLKESLDSFFSQSIYDECELICVNDGSTDGSLAMLQAYQLEHPNVMEIISQKNSGSGIARNAGIRVAKGDFIGFLDADDLYPDNQVLERLYNAAQAHNVQIAGGSLHMFDSETIYTDFSAMRGFEGHTFFRSGLMNYADFQFDYGYQRFIYSRSLLIDNAIFFPDYLRYQDPPFFVKAMLAAGEFYAMAEPSYKYRSAAKSVNWNHRRLFDMIAGIFDVGRLAAENNLEALFKLNLFRLNNDFMYVFKNAITCQKINGVLEELYRMKFSFLQMDTDLNLEELLEDTPLVQEKIVDDLVCFKTLSEDQANELAVLRLQCEMLDFELTTKQQEIERILSSNTWKAGSALTWLPRKVKDR